MELEDLERAIPGLSGWTHAYRIKLFAWYLHTHRGMAHFSPADIKKCYEQLHIASPSSVGPFLSGMIERKEALKSSSGYRLEKRVRDAFDAKHGKREITIQITKLLSELPTNVPNVEERAFLGEALTCFKHGAFRAAIVMTWNLAFDHLCNYVLKHHLASFNAQWPIRFPKGPAKSRISAIAKREDFSELKESEVINICRSANIITADVYKVLDQKLGTRNSAAHPSSLIFTQLEAEEYISNLVNNVVLHLKL